MQIPAAERRQPGMLGHYLLSNAFSFYLRWVLGDMLMKERRGGLVCRSGKGGTDTLNTCSSCSLLSLKQML